MVKEKLHKSEKRERNGGRKSEEVECERSQPRPILPVQAEDMSSVLKRRSERQSQCGSKNPSRPVSPLVERFMDTQTDTVPSKTRSIPSNLNNTDKNQPDVTQYVPGSHSAGTMETGQAAKADTAKKSKPSKTFNAEDKKQRTLESELNLAVEKILEKYDPMPGKTGKEGKGKKRWGSSSSSSDMDLGDDYARNYFDIDTPELRQSMDMKVRSRSATRTHRSRQGPGGPGAGKLTGKQAGSQAGKVTTRQPQKSSKR